MFAASPVVLAQGESTLPEVEGRIADHASMISPSQRHLLHQISSQHERLRGQRITLVTVESTGAIPPQEYADRLHGAWPNEKKGRGVLLVLCKEQQQAAIAMGDELRGKLGNEWARQISEDELGPLMREGKYDEAAMSGYKGITGTLNSAR